MRAAAESPARATAGAARPPAPEDMHATVRILEKLATLAQLDHEAARQ